MLKEGIENGAGIGAPRVGDRDSCLFQGVALIVSRDLTGKSNTCVLKWFTVQSKPAYCYVWHLCISKEIGPTAKM